MTTLPDPLRPDTRDPTGAITPPTPTALFASGASASPQDLADLLTTVRAATAPLPPDPTDPLADCEWNDGASLEDDDVIRHISAY